MSITIIIPSYKKPEQLKKCKQAIKKQTVKCGVFVWDNNKENLGFTKAVNQGLKICNDKYAVILNQDCYLKPDAIKNMVAFMDKNPRCAIGGIKQLSDVNEDMIVHGGCTQAFPNGMHLIGKVSDKHHEKNAQMPWVNGACMIVRMEAVKEIGRMDENFFLISSDSDYCYHARAKGWEVWYIANAVCTHEQDGVSKKPSDNVKTSLLKDVLYFRGKWVDGGLFRELAMEVF